MSLDFPFLYICHLRDCKGFLIRLFEHQFSAVKGCPHKARCAYSVDVLVSGNNIFCVKMKRVNAKISLGQCDKFEGQLVVVTGK